MKNSILKNLIILIILIMSTSLYSQKDDFYKKSWKNVDAFLDNNRPRSAISLIEQISERAKREDNQDQILKCYIFEYKSNLQIDPQSTTDLIQKLENQLANAAMPNKAMLHTILAEIYYGYFQENSYRISQRSQIVGDKPADIKTWDELTFIETIAEHYYTSLENSDELLKIPASFYPEMIKEGTKPDYLRPTLYDFLAYRAIDFFSDAIPETSQPADNFYMNEDFYFAPTETFVKQKINHSNNTNYLYNAAIIMQNLLKIRLLDTSNKDALINADLERLAFALEHSTNINKDSLYLAALKNLETKYPNTKTTRYTKLQIANYYLENYDEDIPKTNDYLKIAHKYYTELSKGVKKYDEVSGEAKRNLLVIEEKKIDLTTENVLLPNKTFAINLEYKNIDKIYIEIRKITVDDIENNYVGNKVKKIRKNKNLIKKYNFNLKNDNDFRKYSTDLLIDGLDLGQYIILMSMSPDFDDDTLGVKIDIQVSNLGMFFLSSDEGKEFTIQNRKNGEGIKNVKVEAYYDEYNYRQKKHERKSYGTYTTDDNGSFLMENSKTYKSLSFKIIYNNDILVEERGGFTPSATKEKETKPYILLFTDRKIYRPGQTVYYKGIILQRNDKAIIPQPKLSGQITFNDANFQKITEKKYTTNEFGSFSGQFTIPVGRMNGNMSLSTKYGNCYFKVEEYKRPTFEAELLTPSKQFVLNDSVELKGKANNYSGAKLTGAKVKYTITRTENHRWCYYFIPFYSDAIIISQGETTTDQNGDFNIKFLALPNRDISSKSNISFTYEITADITDQNGETQSVTKKINIGYTSLVISSDVKKSYNIDNISSSLNKIKIETNNFAGEPVSGKIKMQIFSLRVPSEILRKRHWDTPTNMIYTEKEWHKKYAGNEFKEEARMNNWAINKEIFTKKITTPSQDLFSLSEINNLTPGAYKIKFSSTDKYGKEVIKEENFIIYSGKSNKVPYKTNNWFVIEKENYEVGETLRINLGSSTSNHAFISIVSNRKQIKKELISFDNSQQQIEIPINKNMQGKLFINCFFVDNNRVYSHYEEIFIPFTDKELDVEYATFRDKLLPGQSEQWSIILKNKDAKIVSTEVLASLYDASLDAFTKNSMKVLPYNFIDENYLCKYISFSTQHTSSYLRSNKYHLIKFTPLFYNRLMLYDLFYTDYLYGMSTNSRDYVNKSVRNNDLAFSEEKFISGGIIEEPMVESIALKPEESTQIRKNFAETAFFYPDLKTNEQGEVIIKFVIPESLTKWHFWGFAHTKNMLYANLDKYVVTQKELMVTPNAPRFYRQGDKLFFTAKISNLSDRDLAGTVSLEFTDELSGTKLEILSQGETKDKDFSVAKDQNTNVSWQIEVPENVKMLTYKVIAKSGNFSDGEQKSLPVLTNRILVTDAMPLPINSNMTKKFVFKELANSKKSNTLKTDKLSLEFTSNPAWYAVMALPALTELNYECNESIFSRLYANSLASYIANSSPKIKAVFDTWRNYEPAALLSNLEKNQDLKQLILEETPWVLDAQDESQRKRNIAMLFDINKMANSQSADYQKLNKTQTVNGGWAWFKGMKESWYTTQYIAQGIGHLMQLGVLKSNPEIVEMGKKAIDFCDDMMKEHYDYLKKNYKEEQIKNYKVSSLIISYFYTRTFYKKPLDKKYDEAYKFFYDKITERWTEYDIYNQGLIAIAAYHSNNKKLTDDIIISLRERALHSEELGMYWKDNIVGYFWYQNPIQTQALMIELFENYAKDSKAVDELKINLLKNKQTNDWQTSIATAQAIYALLLTGGTDLLASNSLVTVKLGNKTIDPTNDKDIETEAGTGYYKIDFDGSQVKPNWSKITVENKNNSVAWGAVYWQYFENIDKINTLETPLSLKKELFKEIIEDNNKKIVAVNDDTELKVGDIVVVRIELRADRDMDFVHMKDLRASGLEPTNVISKYKWQDGLGYYETTKDASTNFFFDFLPSGTYVFEYKLRVSNAGDFSNGITTIQCLYAPEFMSHSNGQRIKIRN